MIPLPWANKFRELVRNNKPEEVIFLFLRYCREQEDELDRRFTEQLNQRRVSVRDEEEN